MAKNSNEGVLGSSATIDRLSAGDSVDLRKIVLQPFFGGTKYDRETRTQCLSQATGDLIQIPVFLAKLGLEVEIEEKK